MSQATDEITKEFSSTHGQTWFIIFKQQRFKFDVADGFTDDDRSEYAWTTKLPFICATL